MIASIFFMRFHSRLQGRHLEPQNRRYVSRSRAKPSAMQISKLDQGDKVSLWALSGVCQETFAYEIGMMPLISSIASIGVGITLKVGAPCPFRYLCGAHA